MTTRQAHDYATEQAWRDDDNPETLHITKTIATLVNDPNGRHPMEAAFLAICQDDSEGRYEFSYRGTRTVVTVEREEVK